MLDVTLLLQWVSILAAVFTYYLRVLRTPSLTRCEGATSLEAHLKSIDQVLKRTDFALRVTRVIIWLTIYRALYIDSRM